MNQLEPSEMQQSLQVQVDAILKDYPEAIVAVVVQDSLHGRLYEREPDRVFHAASTMKIPVMIEVFRLAEQGRLSLDDTLLVENNFRSIVDSSWYKIEDDSDDAIYEKLGNSMSYRELVYQMITVSSNLATNLLIDTLQAEAIQRTAEALGTQKMKVLRGVEDIKAFELGLSNTATASDLATLLKALMEGNAVSREADRAMIDILLEQQFNEMIPAGMPVGVEVAHKTGWITRIHHDAAIVYPGDGSPPFVLTILIEGIESSERSAALGEVIARAVYQTIR